MQRYFRCAGGLKKKYKTMESTDFGVCLDIGGIDTVEVLGSSTVATILPVLVEGGPPGFEDLGFLAGGYQLLEFC